jgi:hypothetical protein
MESKDFAQKIEHVVRKRRSIVFREPDGLPFLYGILKDGVLSPLPVVKREGSVFVCPRVLYQIQDNFDPEAVLSDDIRSWLDFFVFASNDHESFNTKG